MIKHIHKKRMLQQKKVKKKKNVRRQKNVLRLMSQHWWFIEGMRELRNGISLYIPKLYIGVGQALISPAKVFTVSPRAPMKNYWPCCAHTYTHKKNSNVLFSRFLSTHTKVFFFQLIYEITKKKFFFFRKRKKNSRHYVIVSTIFSLVQPHYNITI